MPVTMYRVCSSIQSLGLEDLRNPVLYLFTKDGGAIINVF